MLDGDHVAAQLARWGAHQRSDLAVLLALLRGDDVVYDIGAHVGTYAIPIGRRIDQLRGQGHVHAFEPTAVSHELLLQNITANGLEAVVDSHRLLLADRPGTFAAEIPVDHTSAAHYEVAAEGANGISALTLDEWSCGHRPPDVIKIDVEGMEIAVLRGGARTIADATPMLVIEIAPVQLERAGATVGQIDDLLESRRYVRFVNLHTRNTHDDSFRLARIDSCASVVLDSSLYDIVALHRGDPRLAVAMAATQGRVARRDEEGQLKTTVEPAQ